MADNAVIEQLKARMLEIERSKHPAISGEGALQRTRQQSESSTQNILDEQCSVDASTGGSCDDREWLQPLVLSEQGCKTSREHNESELAPVLDEESAFKRILRWCNASERCSAQILERLAREGYSENCANTALERAAEYGIVDDIRYGELLVRSRISQGKGRAGIERELSKLNIDTELIEGWPYEFFGDLDDEVNRALAFLEKHPSRAKNKRDSAYRKLVSKGYSSTAASTAARIYCEG